MRLMFESDRGVAMDAVGIPWSFGRSAVRRLSVVRPSGEGGVGYAIRLHIPF
jgi:hypothetical protein